MKEKQSRIVSNLQIGPRWVNCSLGPQLTEQPNH